MVLVKSKEVKRNQSIKKVNISRYDFLGLYGTVEKLKTSKIRD